MLLHFNFTGYVQQRRFGKVLLSVQGRGIASWCVNTGFLCEEQGTLRHELLARETFSRKIINYSEDMPADQKDRYIHYLVDKVNELDLDKRAMELAVEEFQGIHNNVLEQLAELQRSIAEIKAENAGMRQEIYNEKEKRKRAEAKARKLDQQLKYARKNKFGDQCQGLARKEKQTGKE